MTVPPRPSPSPPSRIGDALAVARYHIVLIAMAACLVFGWLTTAEYLPLIALVAGLDWFLINLLNRVTDIDEDLRNGIRGTEGVAKRRTALTLGGFALMFGSIAATHLVWPELTAFRLLVQAIGLTYNYRVIPTPSGLSRLKEIYFLKNFGSSCLFVLTGFVYPLTVAERTMPWLGVAALIVFFVLFELTYEILYDLRDLEGDRAEGIPTYPVVHGPLGARRIIDGLLVASVVALVLGVGSSGIGMKEALLLAAPPIQLAFYRPRLRRGLTSSDCITVTNLGTALLCFYLLGTALWAAAGLPDNVFPFG